MFKVFLYLVAILGFASAAVPTYMKICGRRNPNLDSCILDIVESLKENLKRGLPDLDIPPLEPLYIDKIPFTDMPNFKSSAINLSLHGLSNYSVNYLHIDLEKKHVELDISFKEIKIDGQYDVDAKILVPVVGKGPLHLIAHDTNTKITSDFKLIERGGKRYIFVPSITTRLTVKDYITEYDTQDVQSTPLREAITQALGSSHKEVIAAVTPSLEKAVSERILQTANKMLKHFTYDEILPDRE